MNRPDSAIFYLQIALEQSIVDNDFFTKSQTLKSLGGIHFRQGKINQAIEELKGAFEAASFSGNREHEMEAAKILYQVYKSQHDNNQALHYHETYRGLQDSLFNEKNVKQIALLEANYEFEKEKQQLAFEQTKENEKQQTFQNIILTALGIAILFLFTIAWYFRSKQKANAALNLLNEKLSKQNEVVEHQKLKLEELDEAKSRFFTNISHEFRTPLTIISGMIDQMVSKPDIWFEKGAKMIKQNSVSLLNLVNQILDLRKLESRNMELNLVQGDVMQYLRYITESYQSYAQSNGVQLHFLADQSSFQMDYDPDKLLRVISNLLSNAIKYTPDGGNIYLHIDQKNERENQFLQIRVKDTGAGIPEDQLANIFGRFYQVDDSTTRKGEGTGIGLALVKELVQLMNGEITVNSEMGKGATFLVKLPITSNSMIQDVPSVIGIEESNPEITAEEETILAVESNSTLPTLLIVEDNPDVVQFLVACLEEDYQLKIAKDGQEGIDAAIEQVPDLIVSDVMMPEKDGFELCDTLKKDERTSHIPIILLTAKADIDSKISGLEQGADAYLTKPFESKELLVRLRKLLELRKRLQNRYQTLEFNHNDEIVNQEELFLLKIRELVEANISDDSFGNVHLARKMKLSESQLYRKIKALTGKSTAIFIRSIRLHKAKDLLKDSDLTISEIAYEVGFTSPAYFSRSFSKEFGTPPNAMRN